MDHKKNWLSYVISVMVALMGALYVYGLEQNEKRRDVEYSAHETRIKTLEFNQSEIRDRLISIPTKEDLWRTENNLKDFFKQNK